MILSIDDYKKKFKVPDDHEHVLLMNGYSPGDSIFIPGNVPSKKNSKQIGYRTNYGSGKKLMYCGKPVTPIIISSAITLKYEKAKEGYYSGMAPAFRMMVGDLPMPYVVEFFFIRETKALFDFGNACQVILDLMQKHGWVGNDSIDHILPIPRLNGVAWTVDKQNAGVIIRIVKKITWQG